MLGELNLEVDSLKACAAVFAISREDQWLLQTLGVHANYLPYYPEPHREAWLLDIRNGRHESEKDSLLVIGTATNAPTDHGMSSILHDLRSVHLRGLRVAVLGRGWSGIESLAKSAATSVYLGYVDDEQLEAELR